MAIRIKDTGSLAKKFVQRASAAAGDYKDGVQAAGSDWEANTKAAEDNYKLGVTQASASEHLGILVRLGLLRPKRIRQWTFYRRDERRIAQAKKVLQAGI